MKTKHILSPIFLFWSIIEKRWSDRKNACFVYDVRWICDFWKLGWTKFFSFFKNCPSILVITKKIYPTENMRVILRTCAFWMRFLDIRVVRFLLFSIENKVTICENWVHSKNLYLASVTPIICAHFELKKLYFCLQWKLCNKFKNSGPFSISHRSKISTILWKLILSALK